MIADTTRTAASNSNSLGFLGDKSSAYCPEEAARQGPPGV